MKEHGLPPKRRATVIDVARLAGVSPGTVSNAINGKRRVDAETRARIDAAIRELGYRPNMAARGMRTGRANTIALFSSMSTAVSAGPSRLGFMMEIAASASLTALTRNVALVLVPPIPDPEAALGAVPLDGALLVEPARDDPFLPILAARAIPTVAIGGAHDAASAHVDLRYADTADLLIGHLHARGARHVPLVIGSSARRYYEVFEARYLDHAARTGMTPRILRIDESRGEAAAEAGLSALLAQGHRVDGLLVPVDALATGALAALRRAGLRVPEDVRVATRYNGLRAQAATPPLTAVELHFDAVASAATLALLDLIDGLDVPQVLTAESPALIERASTR
ncbi:transcriptional regulator, LacI family [Celeribacter indicus]|nr:LacI family DNA-binding transcriptional regulator [Celeribacter indicus]SDW80139.1 transcriptional regulator, LacI family [Celeribacter indicus]